MQFSCTQFSTKVFLCESLCKTIDFAKQAIQRFNWTNNFKGDRATYQNSFGRVPLQFSHFRCPYWNKQCIWGSYTYTIGSTNPYRNYQNKKISKKWTGNIWKSKNRIYFIQNDFINIIYIDSIQIFFSDCCRSCLLSTWMLYNFAVQKLVDKGFFYQNIGIAFSDFCFHFVLKASFVFQSNWKKINLWIYYWKPYL